MNLWEQLRSFLESWFVYPRLAAPFLLGSIGLGLIFGAVWLAIYRPPLFRNPWLWGVAVFSAFFTLLALTFIQIPLQYYIGQALSRQWDQATLVDWLFLSGLPGIILSGLVQEGAKMVPVVVWHRRCTATEPVNLLAIGAVSGAAFGVFEAIWVQGRVFASGWTISAISAYGFLGIAPFWERFFTTGFHTAASAIAAYGLAKGKGWQFYLIASGLHALLNYGVLPYQRGNITASQVEVYVAVVTLAVACTALWLRWRKAKTSPPPESLETSEVEAQDL